MKKQFLIKPEKDRYRTLVDLKNDLNLPEEIDINDSLLIDFIDKMSNGDHSEIITLRYILGYSFGEIEKYWELYYSDPKSFCKTAVKHLRMDILNHFFPPDQLDKKINELVYHKISNRLGLTGKTIREVMEWLMSFDYPASKDVDTVVYKIMEIEPDFNYPLYLLKKPPYPYNLYSYLLRERSQSRNIPVKNVYRKYRQRLILYPNINFYSYFNHADEIFSENNIFTRIFLNNNDIQFVTLYFKNELSVQQISRMLDISESCIKRAINKFIMLLNSDVGISFIHNGFPIYG